MSQPILQTENLDIGYRRRRGPVFTVAAGINVSLEAGECVCLVGPNGAGKSTLLKTLSGMLRPLGGRVLAGGDPVHNLRPLELARRLSVVLTDRVQAGTLSAYGLVALGRYPYTGWTGRLSAHDEERVRTAMSAVGAAELAPRSVLELSDGERQKVMIARALAQDPEVMILDEPTAFLDLPRRVEVLRLLRDLAHRKSRAILLSTHDLDLALRTADHIWVLSRGGLLRCGVPEDLVLDGAFETAFQSEGVEFNRETGSFQVSGEAETTVAVCGEGAVRRWTVRGLERAGLRAVSGEEAATAVFRVEVTPADNSVAWRLTHDGQVAEGRTVEALLIELRQVRWAVPPSEERSSP
jgi:iron complex transport system ATP-binding protein